MSQTQTTHADTLQHSAFYRFVPIAQPQQFAAWLREQCQSLNGLIIVASEGISGAVAGSADTLNAFEACLRNQPAFGSMSFKRSACTTKPYGRMKVQLKPELVQTGIQNLNPHATQTAPSQQLTPQQWRDALSQDDVVVIDNRNSFEYRLGHFANALDPQVRHFRDFRHYIETHAEDWRREGKRVAMYCTGGIRCEKTSAWVSSFGLEVMELEGGILNYFASMPDAEKDFSGECFVFDNRIALNTALQETGTTLEGVYAAEPDGAWRIARAKRLMESVE